MKTSLLDTILDGLEFVSRYARMVIRVVLIVLSLAMLAVVVYSVFMRYVLNAAPTWSEELARFIMVWLALLATIPALRMGRHIGLSSLVEQIFGRFTRAVFFVANIFMLAFFGVLIFSGFYVLPFVAIQRAPSMNIPMWIPYLSVPVASVFLTLETLILLLKKLLPEQKRIERERKENTEEWASTSPY